MRRTGSPRPLAFSVTAATGGTGRPWCTCTRPAAPRRRRRAGNHEEGTRRAVPGQLRSVHERPPGSGAPRERAVRSGGDRRRGELRQIVAIHARGARGDDRVRDRWRVRRIGHPLLGATRGLRAPDRGAGHHPWAARRQRLRVRVPDGAHEPEARAGGGDRVPDAEPGVHLPEFHAGEGGGAARREGEWPGAAARGTPSARAPERDPVGRPPRAARGSEAAVSRALERIRRRAAATPRRLLLAEAGDPRVVGAAARLTRDGLARVGLVCDPAEARATARRADVTPGGVELVDARDPALIARTREALAAARGSKLAEPELARFAADPVFQAALLVREGGADTFVAGAVRATADVLRAALWLIGLAPGVKSVS